MKIFHCDKCEELVFFENTVCLNCNSTLAFDPDLADVKTLEATGANEWKCVGSSNEHGSYRLCANYSQENVCNWVVSIHDPNPLCKSCRLTTVIPNLSRPENKGLWYQLETAKRRLIYTLIYLKLPHITRVDDPTCGLEFNFLADEDNDSTSTSEDGSKSPTPILTGHANGVITINIAEADAAEREKRRTALHEPYRTLLGHFRHEVGHYYWDLLISGKERLDIFRRLFGDETQDYAQALQRHYQNGAALNWQQQFVSAYASTHPWEDWAESWAHYLHMVDTLETAAASGLSLKPKRKDEPVLKPGITKAAIEHANFDLLIQNWFPLTYVLNNLNRGLGLIDAYPFVLAPVAIEKLRFIHETIFANEK